MQKQLEHQLQPVQNGAPWAPRNGEQRSKWSEADDQAQSCEDIDPGSKENKSRDIVPDKVDNLIHFSASNLPL